jgi:hypothetical protein
MLTSGDSQMKKEKTMRGNIICHISADGVEVYDAIIINGRHGWPLGQKMREKDGLAGR